MEIAKNEPNRESNLEMYRANYSTVENVGTKEYSNNNKDYINIGKITM
jgi:hypothetical protein